AVVVGLIAALPTVLFIVTNPSSLQRATGTSIFSAQTQLLGNNYVRLKDDKEKGDIVGLLIDNRRLIYIKDIAAGYLVHFDPNWLFLQGDNPRHHAPGMGNLYLLDLPFLLLGIYFFLFGSFDKRIKYTVLAWLLLSP